MEQLFSLPNGTVDQLHTHAFLGGSIDHVLLSADGDIPVILNSPGSGTSEAIYTVYQEALASWGYIVVGIDHTFDSSPVEFPDGRLVLGTLTDANNTEATIVRTQDVIFIAQHVTPQNLASWITGFHDHFDGHNIDSVKVGIFGHSIGGAAAALAMQNSTSPIEAGCSLDGPFYGSVLNSGFRGPFFFQGASTDSANFAGLVKMWSLIRGWKEAIKINGTSHDDFSDVAVLVPQVPGTGLAQAYHGLLTAKDPARELYVMSVYLKAFFDFALRAKEEDEILRHEVPRYPEVSIDDL
jgi:dienelactone hydrolase